MRLRKAGGLALQLFFTLREAGASKRALSAGMGCRAENFFKTAPGVACPTNLGLKEGKQREQQVPLLTLCSKSHLHSTPWPWRAGNCSKQAENTWGWVFLRTKAIITVK